MTYRGEPELRTVTIAEEEAATAYDALSEDVQELRDEVAGLRREIATLRRTVIEELERVKELLVT